MPKSLGTEGLRFKCPTIVYKFPNVENIYLHQVKFTYNSNDVVDYNKFIYSIRVLTTLLNLFTMNNKNTTRWPPYFSNNKFFEYFDINATTNKT